VHERAPHPHVVERLPGVVHAGDDLALGVAGDRGEPLILLQVGEQLGRGEVRKGVEIARPQRRDLRLRVADEAEGDRFDFGFSPQ
jgi:hypothetical protein